MLKQLKPFIRSNIQTYIESKLFMNQILRQQQFSTLNNKVDKRRKQDNTNSAQLLRSVDRMSQKQLEENLNQILSSLTRQFYKKRTTNKNDIENIHKIFEKTAEMQYITRSSKVSNLAEVASYFNYDVKEFWNLVEKKIIKFNKMTIQEISQFIRAGSYTSHSYSQRTWEHLKTQLYDLLDLIQIINPKDSAKYIVKSIHGLDKAHQIDQDILKSADKYSESIYPHFDIKGICILANIFTKNNFNAQNLFQFLQVHFQNKDNLQQLRNDIQNSTLLLNSYRGLHQIRGLNKNEYQICQKLEEIIVRTLQQTPQNQIYLQDVALLAYSLGMINIGSSETWEYLQNIIMEKFEHMNKADFDMVLAGLMSTTQFQCSLQLQMILEECIMQNYGDDLEEFCMAANLIGKQSGRGNKRFWDTCLHKMIQYINQKDSSPKVMTVYLKLVAKFRKLDADENQCNQIKDYIIQSLEKFNTRDLTSVIHSVSQIKNIKIQDIKPLIDRCIQKSQDMEIKELFELVLAQTYQEQIFNEEHLDNIFGLLVDKIEKLQVQQYKDENIQGLKQIQALVLHLSIYNLGSQKLWDAIVDIYDTSYINQVNVEYQYHLTSLIGLMIKSSYQDSSEDFQMKIEQLIQQYSQLIQDNSRNLSKNANENIKQIEKMFNEQLETRQIDDLRSKDIFKQFEKYVLQLKEKLAQKEQNV